MESSFFSLLIILCHKKESYRRFKDQHTLTTCVEHVIVLSGSRVSCVSRPRSMLTMGATLADAMQSITTLSSSSSAASSSMSTTSSRYAASFARFAYPSLVKLSEHMKSIGEVAVARTANWQRFCAHNVDTMLVLAELALILNEDTASGSTIAPSARLTLSGNLKVKAAGWTTVGRKTPCTGGVAQKRTAGSRL